MPVQLLNALSKNWMNRLVYDEGMLAALVLPIIGGMAGGDPSAVGLVADGRVFCSGVVVSERVVATAAHCVDPDARPEVLFGGSVGEGPLIETVGVWIHPYADTNPYADLALLVLGATAPVEPPLLSSLPNIEPDMLGTAVTIVGHGVVELGGAPGVRTVATTTIAEGGSGWLGYAAGGPQPCVGDSGGPVFLDGAVLGIHTAGDPACEEGGRALLLGSFPAEIRDLVLATAEGAAATGDRCWYDDNCADAADVCRPAVDEPRLSFCTHACASDAGCPPPMTCGEAGECAHPLPSPGAFGSSCTGDAACAGRLCADGMCTTTCFEDLPGDCPEGTECRALGDGDSASVCLPPESARPGCDCAAGGTASAPWWLALLAAAWLRRLRRKAA